MTVLGPVQSLSSSINSIGINEDPIVAIPTTLSPLQASKSQWDEYSSNRSATLSSNKFGNHNGQTNGAMNNIQQKDHGQEQQNFKSIHTSNSADFTQVSNVPEWATTSATNFADTMNLLVERDATKIQQQAPNTAMNPKTDEWNIRHKDQWDSQNSQHRYNLHSSASNNQINVPYTDWDPYLAQRSSECPLRSMEHDEDTKEVDMASTSTAAATSAFADMDNSTHAHKILDQTSYHPLDTPILPYEDHGNRNGVVAPISTVTAPSLEVIDDHDAETITAEDDTYAIDETIMNLGDTKTMINVELPKEASLEHAGPVTTTTMLFATMLSTCDDTESIHLLDSNINKSSGSSLDQQIKCAEAMFAKSDRRQNDSNHILTATEAHPLKTELDEKSVGYSCMNASENEHVLSSVASFLKCQHGSKRVDTVDETMSISSVGETVPSNRSATQNSEEQIAIVTDVSNIEKVGCNIPAINKNVMLNTKVAIPLVSGIDEGSAGAFEYPRSAVNLDVCGMTERIMMKIDGAKQGPSMFTTFKQIENDWTKGKQQSRFNSTLSSQQHAALHRPLSPFVTSDAALGNPKCWTKLREQSIGASLDYDIVFYGIMNGIFLASALLLRDQKLRICVIDSASKLCSNDPEWNVSSTELNELVKMGLLTENDVKDITLSTLPSGRFGFQVCAPFLKLFNVLT